jgi:hypothetical protein
MSMWESATRGKFSEGEGWTGQSKLPGRKIAKKHSETSSLPNSATEAPLNKVSLKDKTPSPH